jgi:multiple RNA-binding domain-containing protein 1
LFFAQITDEKFKLHFSKVGEITEAKLKYTKDGHFRNFGFIGFKTEQEAKNAIEYFNNTYVNATKICVSDETLSIACNMVCSMDLFCVRSKVEECKSLKDASKPRPWSKYAVGSSSYKKLHEKKDDAKEQQKQTTKKLKKIEELLGPLKDDEQFREFVAANKTISSKENIWKNDIDFGSGKNKDNVDEPVLDGKVDDNMEKANETGTKKPMKPNRTKKDDNQVDDEIEEGNKKKVLAWSYGCLIMVILRMRLIHTY